MIGLGSDQITKSVYDQGSLKVPKSSYLRFEFFYKYAKLSFFYKKR